MAIDLLLPENGTIQVGSDTVTFKVRDYRQSGGERETRFIRTMGRNIRRYRGTQTDYSIEMDVRVDGSLFPSLHDTYGSVGSVSLDYNGSYNVSFHNCYALNFIQKSSSEDYLTGTVSFKCAPYDSDGNNNRVIS